MAQIRFFEFAQGNFTQENSLTITSDRSGIAQTGETVWILGPTSVSMYRWGGPFNLSPILSGWVSIYNGSTFTSAVPGIEHMPSSVTWDVSGTVWMATTENDLYHINLTGTIESGSVIPVYPLQNAGVPLGVSQIEWWTDNHLYGSSVFNGQLIQIL